MAIKVRTTFFVYEGGKEIKHVSATSFVNSFEDAQTKVRELTAQYYPDSQDINVILNEQSSSVGSWVVFARSNTNTDMYFLLVMNKL